MEQIFNHLWQSTLFAAAVALACAALRRNSLPPVPAYGYEAVSIHKAAAGQTGENYNTGPMGGLRTGNISVMSLLKFAYDVRDYQIIGSPGWVLSDRYDIILTPDRSETAVGPDTAVRESLAWVDRTRQRVQAVLRDRFGLVLRTEIHELPIYALTRTAKGATISRASGDHPAGFSNGPGHAESIGAPVKLLTDFLSRELSRPVVDETGLGGQYDFKLDWTPDSDTSGTGPSIFTALNDQLGLKLESKKGPVQVYVVGKIEHPTEN
jgi:bla regulator protein blaR1